MNTKEYKCNICNKFYASYKTLWDHTKNEANENVIIPIENVIIPIENIIIPIENVVKPIENVVIPIENVKKSLIYSGIVVYCAIIDN